MSRILSTALFALLLGACPGGSLEGFDAGSPIRYDAGLLYDTAMPDLGDGDRSLPDLGGGDMNSTDANFVDQAAPDTAGSDSSPADRAVVDAIHDAGSLDQSSPDLDPPDSASPDSASPDSASPDAGVQWQDWLLVINEVDYDQPSTDGDEFVEIKNNGTSAVDLATAGVELVLYNGKPDTAGIYKRIDLAAAGSLPAGAYLVVASSTVSVGGGSTTLVFSTASGDPRATNNIENGNDGPDGLALYHGPSQTLLDALSYAGAITATIDEQSFSLVEGTATTLEDIGTEAASLCRMPDGSDSDDAASDWVLCSTPTPGTSNQL